MNSKKQSKRSIWITLVLVSITFAIGWTIVKAKNEVNMLDSWNKGSIVKFSNDYGEMIIHYSFLDTIGMSNYWSESSLLNFEIGKRISLGDSILVGYSSEKPEISIPFLIDESKNGNKMLETVTTKYPSELISVWEYLSL